MQLRRRHRLALGAVCLWLLLGLTGSAAAAGPRFGLFDLDAGLARASHNAFGDVRVARSASSLRREAPGATLVRCSGCRLGDGWLAFSTASALAAADLRGAKARLGRRGWAVSLTLTARGRLAWARASRAEAARTRRTGLPSVVAVVVDGAIVALPLSNDIGRTATTVELPGFTKSGAERTARLLGS